MKEDFYKKLKIKIHDYISITYDITNKFPKTEIYGTVSQLRRASVSIMLNFVEGFARFKPKVKLNFFEISYGSLSECKYIIYLAKDKEWINSKEYNTLYKNLDEIGAMLYSIISGIKMNIK